MNETNYIKCPCLHCGQQIEFPASAIGDTVQCAYCSKQIVLQGPVAGATDRKLVPVSLKSPSPIRVSLPVHLARPAASVGGPYKRDFKVAGSRVAKPGLGVGGASGAKRQTTLAIVSVAVLLGAILSIYGIHIHEQKRAREQEAARSKAEQTRLAMEEAAKRSAAEAEQERARVAMEEENEAKRVAQAEENERAQLAQAQEQKRLAELEQERILSQLPVALASNNFVELSFSKGELLDFDSEGIHLYTEDRPVRFPWAMLTEDDANILLRTPKGFEATTAFGSKANLPADDDASDLRQQMRKIWRQGSTLKERFTTRMEILGICDEYNRARARYITASANSLAYDAAARKAKDQADQAAAQQRAGSFYALSPSARQSYLGGVSPFDSTSSLLQNLAANQIMSASSKPDYNKANLDSQAASAQAAGAVTVENALDGYVGRLAGLGFNLPNNGEYPIIPPMNLRREIAAELNANLLPSALTSAPSAPANTAKLDLEKSK
ncbi:MAG: hypothetical protein ABSF38_01745 [Verrucomicrobiota bacterium]|jgi:DNA-directed RNA polymerase subunit RPC12/RpoP/chemotaxis protein histidine kinase CheA